MDKLINTLNESGIDVIGIYNSTPFSVVKFVLGIYVVVLLADIILLLIQRGLSGDLRETLIGMNVPAELVIKKNKLFKKWGKIIARAKSERPEDWKIAVIEGDDLIGDLLERMNYSGESAGDRLMQITSQQIENIEELRKAHETRNRIIHEENFDLTKEQTKEIMGYFENFLRYFEVLN